MYQGLQFLLSPLADGLPHQDAGGGGGPVGDDGEDLVNLHGNGVGRRHIASQVAQNPGLNHLGRAPEGLVDEDRRGDLGIVPDVAGVNPQEFFCRQVQPGLLVF